MHLWLCSQFVQLKLHIKVARECNPNNQVDPETLKRALERAGYTAKLHALAGKKLHGLRHEFLTVCLPGEALSSTSLFLHGYFSLPVQHCLAHRVMIAVVSPILLLHRAAVPSLRC